MARNISWAIDEIKSLNVQGAINVAIFSLKFLKKILLKKKDDLKILDELMFAKLELVKARPTEPAQRNAINYVFDNFSPNNFDKKRLLSRIENAIEFISLSNKIIAKYGFRKINSGDTVYTHCHSSTVLEILKMAKDERKQFSVRNTETRPLFQGRKTAKELVEYGIHVEHFIDSAMRVALKKSDIVILGADAITDYKIYNKIGSEIICEIAMKLDIPVYIAALSWKYDPLARIGFDEVVEERDRKEVWPNAPKKLKIHNPAFEMIDPSLISGIICEFGILPFEVFIEETRKKYPFISK